MQLEWAVTATATAEICAGKEPFGVGAGCGNRAASMRFQYFCNLFTPQGHRLQMPPGCLISFGHFSVKGSQIT